MGIYLVQLDYKTIYSIIPIHSCYQRFSIKKLFINISQYSQENTCIRVCFNFIKKSLQHRYFPVNIAKFLSTPTLKNICKRLLLNITFNDQYPHHIETNRLTCSAHQLISFYMMETLIWSSRPDVFAKNTCAGVSFNKVASRKACSFIKERFQHICFGVLETF